tara:strand:+ start:1579 stop:1809 length:231 start_codon:yes stop_codon:yes gene_type:complete
MKVKKVSTDGWDCVPGLREAAHQLDEIGHHVYEIKHCVRVTKLEDLVYDLKYALEEVIQTLDDIDVDVEYITKEEE